ncbi:chromosome segregation protein SMC [Oxyplasma meridianum]|uniref:Chromosome partition protein Smc n=1 Tax=Oxyplasma meridianum TaxID=3073602 RepID=A0AAX4NGN3_9ARCH
MIIESLELDNFKSFGKKTKIVFKKGFTVISGPNGSGKSNIGDSLLFVLGVRSSKTVRADRLGDLVHNPPSGKKKKDYCSVTITINTEEIGKPEEERIIRITRELLSDLDGYRSVYSINGTRCKLSDVERLLDALHIYLDSYSFVLQGDINNIIKMTGVERRKLLESIAGIEGYDIQIAKAKDDMGSIDDNITRLDILKEEAWRRSQELKIQKEAAEKYNVISRKIKDMRTTLVSYEIEAMKREKTSMEQQIERINSEISIIENKIREQETSIAGIKAHMTELERERDSIAGFELTELRKKIENRVVETATRKMGCENLETEIRELEQKIKENLQERDDVRKILAGLELSKNENNLKIAENIRKIGEKEYELSLIRKENESGSKFLIDAQKKLNSMESDLSDLRIKISDLDNKRQDMLSERTGISSKISHLEEDQKTVEFQIKDAQWRLRESGDVNKGQKEQREKLTKRYYDLKALIQDLGKQKDDINRELLTLGREYERIQASNEKKNSTTGRSLHSIMAARNEARISGIHGPVRELISFDDEYRSAIESSAGSRLNAVVVDDDLVAAKCLEVLKKEKTGKLTFLPLNKMTIGRPRGKAIIVSRSEGSLGYVFETVKYDKIYENVIWYAFQDTVIVRDVDTARKYMVGVRLVTMDGDIFEASGAITGGFSEKRSGFQDSEARISDLSAKLRELNEELNALGPTINEKNMELEEITRQLTSMSRSEGSSGSEEQHLKTIVEEGKVKLEKLKTELEDLGKKLKFKEKELGELENQRFDLARNIELLESGKRNLLDKMRENSPETMEIQEKIERELNQLKTEETALNEQMYRIDRDFATHKEREKNFSDSIRKLKEEVEKAAMEQKQVKKEYAESDAELKKLRMFESQLDSKSKEFNEKLQSMQRDIDIHNENIRKLEADLSTQRGIVISLNAKLDTNSSRTLEKEREMAELGGEVMVDRTGSNELKRGIEALSSEIESLGPINQKAIEEYTLVTDEFGTLVGEIDKLRDEKKSLEDLMKRINDEKKKAFLKLYYSLKTDMNSIYYNLSGGGEAQLILSNENDPLNSEVHIRARPKGTNFSRLDALSGGEKSLTSLAFIMAVQRTKPSPIYYLDEVDMFLDGANAERTGSLFMQNSKTSQILVVSLRKAMLKYADHVIGVTIFDDANSEVFEKTLNHGTEAF